MTPLTSGTFRYTDEHLTQRSGIFYENLGPLKLITSKWNLTAYINLYRYNGKWTVGAYSIVTC